MMEAMSAGLPVVACKSCHASAELIDEKCGILVEDGIGPFADGLVQLMQDQELRIRMGNAAKNNAGQYAPEKSGISGNILYILVQMINNAYLTGSKRENRCRDQRESEASLTGAGENDI